MDQQGGDSWARDGRVLDELYRTVEARRTASVKESRTARLFAKGPAKIAQKVGEEAVETVIEAVGGNVHALKEESADLLYHLLVLWAQHGIEPRDVWTVLAARRRAGAAEPDPED
jgi:phosphoribosyl-ATP pyrophosphohydrolase